MTVNHHFYHPEKYNEPVESFIPLKVVVNPTKSSEVKPRLVYVRALVNKDILVDVEIEKMRTVISKNKISALPYVTGLTSFDSPSFNTEMELDGKLPILKPNHKYMKEIDKYFKRTKRLNIPKADNNVRVFNPELRTRLLVNAFMVILQGVFDETHVQQVIQGTLIRGVAKDNPNLTFTQHSKTYKAFKSEEPEELVIFNFYYKTNCILQLKFIVTEAETLIIATSYRLKEPRHTLISVRDKVTSGIYSASQAFHYGINKGLQIHDELIRQCK